MTNTDLKAWRTLQAQLLLGGFHADLAIGENLEPRLVVTRWAQVREFSDLGQATAWARQVLGHQPLAAQDVRPIRATHEIRA